MDSYNYKGTYLENFDEYDRSLVTQYFCLSFREWAQGRPSPAELVTSMCARVLRAYREDHPRAELLEGIYNTMKSKEALRFAAFIVKRESMPAEESARLKAKDNEFYQRKYISEQAPTPKQIAYLRKLGSRETPANRLEASALIDSLVAARSKGQAA